MFPGSFLQRFTEVGTFHYISAGVLANHDMRGIIEVVEGTPLLDQVVFSMNGVEPEIGEKQKIK